MVYHSEQEEDTCHYKLSDRDNCKVSSVGHHFAGFLDKLKETIRKRSLHGLLSIGPGVLYAQYNLETEIMIIVTS